MFNTILGGRERGERAGVSWSERSELEQGEQAGASWE